MMTGVAGFNGPMDTSPGPFRVSRSGSASCAKLLSIAPRRRLAIAVALDDWASVSRRIGGDRPGAKRLSEVAQSADPNRWRGELRAALDQTDRNARLAALQAAATSAEIERLSPVSLDLLGRALATSGDPAGAETVFRAAYQRHPDDVWINYDLAIACVKRNQFEDAIRFLTAAARSVPPPRTRSRTC